MECHTGFGFSWLHPNWIGAMLWDSSDLVCPEVGWLDLEILPDRTDFEATEPLAARPNGAQFSGGKDRYGDITSEDFFDDAWDSGNSESGDGICALTQLDDLASVCVPDLYSPFRISEVESVADAALPPSDSFECCCNGVEEDSGVEPRQVELMGLRLDPTIPDDLERIVNLQERVVGMADRLQRFVALLDVPPGLSHDGVKRWRSRFQSSYAAAYHPWLAVPRSVRGTVSLHRVNPSAVAAGIIARQESSFGLSHGPANVLVQNAVSALDRVTAVAQDELHRLGINVHVTERDGIRLSAGRTLSTDVQYRQLSVRRLMLMLRRVLEREFL